MLCCTTAIQCLVLLSSIPPSSYSFTVPQLSHRYDSGSTSVPLLAFFQFDVAMAIQPTCCITARLQFYLAFHLYRYDRHQTWHKRCSGVGQIADIWRTTAQQQCPNISNGYNSVTMLTIADQCNIGLDLKAWPENLYRLLYVYM